MKTLFYSLLVLFGGCVLVSCNDDDDDSVGGGGSSNGSAMRLDSMYVYSYGSMGKNLESRQIYTYNERGLQDTVFYGGYHQGVGGLIYGQNYHVYTYDDKDSLISDLTVCDLSSMIDCKADSIVSLYKWKTDYIRNAKGQITAEISYRMNTTSGEWDPYLYKNEYTYDAAGRLTMKLHYSYDYGSYDEDQKIEYTYNSNGGVKTETISNKKYGEWYQDDVYDYSYNGNNRLTQKILNNNGLKQRTVYTYDSNGNLTTCITSGMTYSNTWPDQYKTEYLYENNRMTSRTDYDYKDGSWVRNSLAKYSYNQYGVINAIQNCRYDDGQWTLQYETEFFYSEKK